MSLDLTRPLAVARFGTIRGHERNVGDPITVTEEPEAAGEVTAEEAGFLHDAGYVTYADRITPTPVETPRQAAERTVEMEPLTNSWYMIRAPWLEQGVKVQGIDKAGTRQAEIIEEGVEYYRALAEAPVEAAPTIETPATPTAEVPATNGGPAVTAEDADPD